MSIFISCRYRLRTLRFKRYVQKSRPRHHEGVQHPPQKIDGPIRKLRVDRDFLPSDGQPTAEEEGVE